MDRSSERHASENHTGESHLMQEGDEGRQNFNICVKLQTTDRLPTLELMLGFNWSNRFYSGKLTLQTTSS